ncbi:MAG: VanZ family protein [Opitutaceae bacterium]|nr:VanZ family protein [Opitutaceae bacterium]
MADSRSSFSVSLKWLWAVALAGTLVLASGNTPPRIPGSFIGLDKIAHFSLFGLLATLVLRVDRVWGRPGWRGWIAVLAVSVFGITDEWHQSFTPGRSVEFADWIADTAGAALATTLYLNWGGYRRVLETPLRVRRRKLVPKGATMQS